MFSRNKQKNKTKTEMFLMSKHISTSMIYCIAYHLVSGFSLNAWGTQRRMISNYLVIDFNNCTLNDNKICPQMCIFKGQINVTNVHFSLET